MLPTKAPLVYIHGALDGNTLIATELESLIPISKTVEVQAQADGSAEFCKAEARRHVKKSISTGNFKSYSSQDTTIIFTDKHTLTSAKSAFNIGSFVAQEFQAAATKLGRNFVCVVLATGPSKVSACGLGQQSTDAKANPTAIDSKDGLGGNICDYGGPYHLRLNVHNLPAAAAAKQIYEHLFRVFPVKEHLHLIPDSQMKVLDKNFPNYKYCALADAKRCPSSDFLQFVCLIESAPEVRGQQLHWRVVDRSGVGNFYFQWQGESSSSYTWNWILALKPGDRKALPRRPSTGTNKKTNGFIMEPAPVRGVRKMVASVCITNSKLCLWVADKVHPEGKQRKDKYNQTVDKKINVFDEKGGKVWDSDAETVTSQTSIMDEKTPNGLF